MNRSRFGDLEVLASAPESEAHPVPLLFVHGAYAGAWCWAEHFMPWFADAGFASYAVSLSGHGHSRRRDLLDSYSISDYVNDLAEVVAELPVAPVLIGHSMGGMVVQKYLEHAEAPATVLMASVPPQGLWTSAVGLMFSKPTLLQDLNRIMGGGAAQASTLRDALFHQPVDPDDMRRYLAASQPESHRAIWDMTLFNLPMVSRMTRAPMLILGAEHDQLIPPSLVRMTSSVYGLDDEIFPDMGHAMMLEKGWEAVAVRIRDWLRETLDA